MTIHNHTQNITIATHVRIADRVISRMVGLLNQSSIDKSEALIICPCNQIHMFFMKFPIDVIFTDRNGKVVGLVENIKPFHMSKMYRHAYHAIELFPGTISATGTCLGDRVQVDIK